MGAIVHTSTPTPSLPLSCFPKPALLSLSNYTLVRTQENGLTHVRLDTQQSALFLSKRISHSTYSLQKESLLKWVNTAYKHSCSVLQYHSETESVFCNSHVSFKAVIEYSDRTLASTLANCSDEPLDQSQAINNEGLQGTPLSTLKFIKFLIEATQEQFKTSKTWINFHTTNILHFPTQNQFKYLYIPLSEDSHQSQIFFDPENAQTPSKYNQKTTVFSIGMVLLSLLLKQDCSDCYNYYNFTFCQSVFQQKIQKLQLLTSRDSNLNGLCYSNVGLTIQEQIADLTLAATAPSDYRPTFADIKSKYYKLLRQISTGYQTGGCGSTRRVEAASYRRDNSILDRKKTYANIKGFQAQELSKPKKLVSQFDDSRCVLRQLECQENVKSTRKSKENAAIKLKSKMMKKIQEQNKQNIGFRQGL